MAEIKIAFWNLQNLFDTTASEIAADLEFTPEHGWDEEAFEEKITNLATIIRAMHHGSGPDLLGICEIENRAVATALLKKIGRPEYTLAHVESPDIRGIDVSLIYSKDVLTLVGKPKGHLVHFRYPTRDIFQVTLRVKLTSAELNVLVNHWPSRKQGQYESEPARITVAEHCGRLVDEILKYSRSDFLALPDTAASLARLNERWNRNVLVMGDLNDEPFNRSILDYLRASRDRDHLEEEIVPARNKKLPAVATYLKKRAYLFNCMWPLLGRADTGTSFFPSGTNTMLLLDQFIISRGLLYGLQGLKMDLESVRIMRPDQMTSPKGRPVPFDKKTKKGFSDHFPIEAVIQTV
ncbi:MAG TPA: hypothetical protein VNM72_11955 [Blastocatellia bacterium]|nr:hypothetical protein [Blastocatellia bacterium]